MAGSQYIDIFVVAVCKSGMKIICFTRSLALGGAERQITGLASMLSGAGHRVEVLTYRPDDFYACFLDENGVGHTCIPKRNGWQIVSDIVRHFKREKPDVVISFLSSANLKACRAHRRWPRFKLVVSERNVNLRYMPHDAFRFLAFREADVVVANSHTQEAFVRKHAPWLGGRLAAVVNFTDTDRFMPGKGRGNARPVICTTARVDSRKNVLGLIDAAGILRERGLDFEVRWYGLVNGNRYYRKCIRRINARSLSDRFFILPAVKDVETVYGRSDIFCLPSFYEGTSNALAEALACGVPAACSGVSDNGRYVIDGKTGFIFDPHDPESMALALSELLSLDSNARSAMGEAARRTMATGLSREAFAENYMNLLGRKD